MRRSLVFVLGILLALFVVPQLLFAQDGAAIYKTKCSACHGPDGEGQTALGKMNKIRSLSSADVQKQSDADLAKIIEGGKGKMPAYKGKLTAEEITSVVKHLRTFKK